MNPDSDSYGQLSKHYYAGTERIASRLAGPAAAFAEAEDLEGAHVEALPALQRMDIRMPLHGWDIGFDDPSFANDTLPEANCSLYPSGSEEHKQCLCDQEADCPNVIYWYHPDHLGSSTFLTDAAGEPYQFLMYLPFGETFAEQRAGGFGTPYLFNAKELDEETGLYYYGARYYDPRISTWWGVDPLAEKYTNLSPYAFVANNPLLYVDPDGREIWIYYQNDKGEEQRLQYTAGMKYKGDNQFVASAVNGLNQMNSTKDGSSVLSELIGSENAFNVTNTYAKDKNGNDITGTFSFAENSAGGGQINAAAFLEAGLGEMTKLEGVSHELFHGYQHERGQGGGSIMNEVEAGLFGYAVALQYSMDNGMPFSSGTPMGRENEAGTIYQSAFNNLTWSNRFSSDDFKNAVTNFKAGSVKNTSGIYNNLPLRRSNQTRSLISRFYPLIE